jgi:Apoptosis-antagonizing transcription factor, C-terminal
LIDETLVDHKKLLAMTRISRGKKGRIGALQESVEVPDAADPDIFDDTDFYQKMLRDIIDAREDSNGGEDWMILQKQKKAKKKVDTKASKGRKLKFVNGLAHVVFSINLYLIGMKFMRSCKALWFQSPFLGHGMMSRLTSCSLRFSGKALRMWV